MKRLRMLMAAGLLLAGCGTRAKVVCDRDELGAPRVAALDARAWEASERISFSGAKVVRCRPCLVYKVVAICL